MKNIYVRMLNGYVMNYLDLSLDESDSSELIQFESILNLIVVNLLWVNLQGGKISRESWGGIFQVVIFQGWICWDGG